MRLLVITANYPPSHVGGYEIRCKEVIDHLKLRGYELLVLTSQSPEFISELCQFEEHIIRFLHLKCQNIFRQIFNDIIDIDFIHQKVKQFQPDLIYFWDLENISNAILPYFADKNFPMVYDEGSSGLVYLTKILRRGLYFFKNPSDPIIKRLAKESIYCIVHKISRGRIKPYWSWPYSMHIYFNCNSALEYAKANDVPVENARVIYSGILIEDFPFKFHEKLGKPIKIIVPGRIKPIKGTLDSIDLLCKLQERNIRANLTIVGAIQSDEYYAQIIQKIHQHQLSDKVTLLPMVTRSELATLYQSSDFCFFPSYFKTGFSRTPLEAMASGCVVITYGNEGTAETIQNWVTGQITAQRDFESAVNFIEILLKNPQKFQEIAKNARKRVEIHFSMKSYCDSIENYLLEAISSHS